MSRGNDSTNTWTLKLNLSGGITMKRATAFFAAIALCAVCSTVFAVWGISDEGTWPKSWPKALEPLRKQSRTLVGGMVDLIRHEIHFTNQKDFEAAWPHILKVKRKGAPIILVRGPTDHMGKTINSGVVIHCPPAYAEDREEPATPLPGTWSDARMRWTKTTFIELIVDGDIVDLNRITLPADTPIIDERFKDQPPRATSEMPAREKMLIRFVLQNEFTKDLGHLLDGRNDLAEKLQNSSFTQMLESVSRASDATLRCALILELGTPGIGGYDPVKVRETFRQTIKSEPDKWLKLELARVLAALGDDAGKDVLVSAIMGRDGYMTQSGIEIRKAVLPLLLLDYDFPSGFPKYVINYEWGGIHEYFDAIRKERALPVADVSPSISSATYADDNSTVLEKNTKDKTKSFSLQYTGPFAYSQVLLSEDLPVHIDYIRFAEEVLGNLLSLGFTFNGKKDPQRIIILKVTAKNSSGKVIAEDEVRCPDARISVMEGGSFQNVVHANLRDVKPDHIAQLEVKFTQEFQAVEETDGEKEDGEGIGESQEK
jgi:hypothetical protein